MSLEEVCPYWSHCEHGDRNDCKEDYQECPYFFSKLSKEYDRAIRNLENETFKY